MGPHTLEEKALLDDEQTALSFSELDLSPPVLQAVNDLGYVSPTPVQATVIPLMRSGLDLIVQARTGTGKTAAFGIPLVERFSGENQGVAALVVTPTRELALQVAAEIDALGCHKGVRTATVYGGVAIRPQVRALERAQVVVGTPGRLLDHLRRGSLSLSAVQLCVLDEADEMLSMGFLEDVEAILQHLPPDRQFLLASATIPQDVLVLSQRYMTAPEFVSLSSDAVAATQVQHSYYVVLGKSRLRALARVLRDEAPENAIIFCNTRADTALVGGFLRGQGYEAEVLNGDLPQHEREKIMTACKEKRLRFMVATDVAARGIDISGLSHVVNYQLPEQVEMYIHRTGRTGRAGRTGQAISLISPHEMGTFYYLRKTYDLEMTFKELPSEEEESLDAAVLARELQRDEGMVARRDAAPPLDEPAGGRKDASDRPPRPRRAGERRSGEPRLRAREDSRPPRGEGRDDGGRRPPHGAGLRPLPGERPADGTGEAGAGAHDGEAARPSSRRGDNLRGRRRREPGERPADARLAAAGAEPGGEMRRGGRAPAGTRQRGRKLAAPAADSGMVRLHLNAGTNQFPGGEEELRTLLASSCLLPESSFGRIDLYPGFSFVEVPEGEAGALLERMQSRDFKGVVLHLERARPRGER